MPTFPGTPTRPPPPRFRRRPRWPEAFAKQEAAQDAIDLATFRRIHDETMSAALLSARDAPDEASATAIRERASQSVSAITSQRPQVQQAYARFYEGSQASWQDRFSRQAAAIKDKQAHDQGVLNVQAEIEKGDEVAAATGYQLLIAREPENKALYEQGIADIPFDAPLMFASKAIDSGEVEQIYSGLETLRGMSRKGLRKEQLAALNKLTKAGQAEVEARQNDNYRATFSAIFEIDTAETPLERYKAIAEAEKVIDENKRLGLIDPRQAVTLRSHVRSREDGPTKPDPLIEAQAWTMIQDPAQDRAVVDEWLWDHAAELGTRLPDLIKANAEKRNKREDYDSQAAVSAAVAKYEMDSNDEADFRRMEYYELNGKGFSAEDKHARAMADAVTFMAARPPRPAAEPFTQLRVQETLGILERGGSYIDPETKEVIPFPSTGAMRDYLLARLGPEWHLVSPEALRIVKRRAPLASWHYQSAREKAAILERARGLDSAFWDGTVLEGDITEGDREVAVEIAPSGPITPKQVQAFEDYIDATGTPFPKPAPGPSDEVLTEMGVDPALFGRFTLEGFVTPPEIPAGLPVVETDADFDALPSGAAFIAPDGTRRRKP